MTTLNRSIHSLITGDDPIPIAAVLEAATSAGLTDLPSETHLTTGRVWPAGNGWVAEIGQPPHNRTIERLHRTQDDALTAIQRAIDNNRAHLAARVTETSNELAHLGTTRTRWQPPPS